MRAVLTTVVEVKIQHVTKHHILDFGHLKMNPGDFLQPYPNQFGEIHPSTHNIPQKSPVSIKFWSQDFLLSVVQL
jgi:hypothetical protein